MWNEPTKQRLAKIPKLYETEGIPLQDKKIHLHFFIGGSDWYKWGYVSFSELKSLKINGWLEVDCEIEEVWKVRKASEIDKIRIT
jgi:hypothetical protein